MERKLFSDRPLFKQCVESLNAAILSSKESDEMEEIFEKIFPITKWGKVDWSKIKKSVHIGFDPDNIVPSLQKLLGVNFDTTVYIMWSHVGPHVIKTDLESIVRNFDDVSCVSLEKFIFNPNFGYVVEIRTGDDMTVGVIDQ